MDRTRRQIRPDSRARSARRMAAHAILLAKKPDACQFLGRQLKPIGRSGKVDLAFRQVASEEPQRVRIIDASGSPDEVTGRLLQALDDLLP